MFIIITGNPGLGYFYEDLKNKLSTIDETIISPHRNHEATTGNDYKNIYGLEDQINHHYCLVSKYLATTNVVLIGHSIGAYISLALLERLPNISQVFLITPTIYKLSNSPRGKKLKKILNAIDNPRIATHAIYNSMVYTPEFMRNFIIKKIFDADLTSKDSNYLISNLNAYSMMNIICMVKDELSMLEDKNMMDFLVKQRSKVKVLLAERDEYVPVYVKDEIYTISDATVSDISHGFMFKDQGNDKVFNYIASNYSLIPNFAIELVKIKDKISPIVEKKSVNLKEKVNTVKENFKSELKDIIKPFL